MEAAEGSIRVNQIQSEVKEEVRFAKDPLDRAAQLEWKIFCRVSQEQITQDMIRKVIDAREASYRERANRELAESGGEQSYYYQVWSEVHDALMGLQGKEPISKTIAYLRKDAAGWKKMADDNRRILDRGGPFSKNPFTEIPLKGEQIAIWDKISDNLNTAARLIENQPRLVLAEEPQL